MQPIPATWALDAHGRPTTDPHVALDGVLQAIGGPKGAGLAIMMDVFGGVISGASYAGDVGDMYKALDRPQNVGHFSLAMPPDLFITLHEYRLRMDTLVERINSCTLADGFSEVLMPGEIESREERRRTEPGFPFTASHLDDLNVVASRAAVDPLPSATAY